MENEQILKKLDAIVFHDIPVERIAFKTEGSTDFIIDFALYQENNKDYEYWTINFVDIIELNTDKLQLNSESDLEIYSFDYSLKDFYECKVQFLCGFGQPSFNVELKCKEMELNKTTPNTVYSK